MSTSIDRADGPGPTQAAPRPSAEVIRDVLPATFLYGCIARVVPGFDPEAYRLHREDFLRDAGSPTDPIEVVLIESLMAGHLIGLALNYKALGSDGHEAAGTYLSAGARLAAETRRTALAISEYRKAAGRRPAVHDGPAHGGGKADDGHELAGTPGGADGRGRLTA